MGIRRRRNRQEELAIVEPLGFATAAGELYLECLVHGDPKLQGAVSRKSIQLGTPVDETPSSVARSKSAP
jgi:hypothetical protein